MIDKILQPLLSLHGWQAYALVGVLVFAEAAVLLGFVFPGETAALLGGVLASKGGVTLPAITVVVVLCAIVGDSVGYAVGDRWGRKLLNLGPLRKRQKGIDMALDQLSRRGATAVFVARFSAFLRAVVPGLAGMSSMPYRIFLPANAIGGILLGRPLRHARLFRGRARGEGNGHRVGHPARDHPRRDRRAGDPAPPQEQAGDRRPGRAGDAGGRPGRLTAPQVGGSSTERSPARRPSRTRANSPAASLPWASVSSQRGADGSRRSMPNRPKRGSYVPHS